MNQALIQEAELIHKLLQKEGNLNKTRVQSMLKLLTGVSFSLETAGTQMLNTRNEFSKMCESDTTQSDCLKDLIEYMSNILKTLGRMIQDMGKDIRIHMVDPIQNFSFDVQITSKKCTEHSLDIIDEIQENNTRLNKIEMAFKEKKNVLMNRNSILMNEENKYRGEMISTNEVWARIQYRYTKLLEDLDVANQQRCDFTKKTIVDVLKILNRLPQSEDVQAKIQELEKVPYVQYQTQENIVLSIQQEYGRSQLLRPLKMFESMKMKFQQDDRQLLMKMKEIQNFSETYLVKMTSQVNLKTRSLILESPHLSDYFLCCLCCKLHTQKSLPTEKFNDLLTLVKYIFAQSMQIADNQSTLYGILYLSMRIVNQGALMIKQLSKYADYWENEQRWDSIYNQIFDHLNKQHFLTKKSTTKRLQRTSSMMVRNNRNTHRDKNEDTVNKKYQAMREVNALITQLSLNNQFTIRYVMNKCKEFNLSRNQTETLLFYQEQAKKNNLNNMYFSYKATAERRTDHLVKSSRLGFLYAIKKSLKFLDITKDKIYRLRLVCKKWAEQLRVPIIRRCLCDANLNVIERMRVKLYQALIPQAYSSSLYKRMLAQIPDDFSQIQQIDMDVKRSLNNRPEQRDTLKDMLMAFSFYNQKIGYLQGMNYIGENILKLNMSPQSSYCMLEYLLRKHFSLLFSANLDNLKVKLYQFMRLLERYLPNLYKHLENQKIESEHFLVPWIITLWGEMEGDIVWLMWDGFLIDGWKWWAKMCLWLLSIFEADLLQMNFEQILKFFSDLPSNAFFKCKFNDYFVYALSPLKIKDDIHHFKVTKKMLDLLESQYLYSQKKYKEIMMTQ